MNGSVVVGGYPMAATTTYPPPEAAPYPTGSISYPPPVNYPAAPNYAEATQSKPAGAPMSPPAYGEVRHSNESVVRAFWLSEV